MHPKYTSVMDSKKTNNNSRIVRRTCNNINNLVYLIDFYFIYLFIGNMLPGKRAVVGYEDGTVRVWDLKQGNAIHVIKG